MENYIWVRRFYHIPFEDSIAQSNCNISKKGSEFLKQIMQKAIVLKLLYRGSRDGWTFKDFHLRCDLKAPTISLFQISDGDCIGGYTEAQWSSDNKRKRDNKAFLFNLT